MLTLLNCDVVKLGKYADTTALHAVGKGDDNDMSVLPAEAEGPKVDVPPPERLIYI